MVEADFGGEFLSYENTKDGDMIMIISKPEFGELTFQGKTKKVTNIPVTVGGRNLDLIYTPTNKAGKSMVEAWGKEMDNWVNKKFEILHIEGKMIIRPISEVKV